MVFEQGRYAQGISAINNLKRKNLKIFILKVLKRLTQRFKLQPASKNVSYKVVPKKNLPFHYLQFVEATKSSIQTLS